MSKEFPRRRDVREMANKLMGVLERHDTFDGEFDNDFLTEVRDLMREGVTFADAVIIAGVTDEPTEPT